MIPYSSFPSDHFVRAPCAAGSHLQAHGFSTVLVGFVREHIEIIKPPRALWLNFSMGRPWAHLTICYQKIIRSAFKLLEKKAGPVLEDFQI